MRIMSYYRPVILVVVMTIMAGIYSLAFPALGLISAKYQYIMIENQFHDVRSKRDIWSLYWLLLCIGIGLMSATERSIFGVMGESLTYRVRKDLVRGVIYKQLSWFDRESHAPGVLTNVFSEDVSSLNGMTTEVLCTVTEALLGLVLGVCVALIYCWQQALLTILTLPILIIGVVAMSRL